MLFGAFWFIGGILVTSITYNAAASSSTGGTYVIAWGAILFGFIDLVRGFFGWIGDNDSNASLHTSSTDVIRSKTDAELEFIETKKMLLLK